MIKLKIAKTNKKFCKYNISFVIVKSCRVMNIFAAENLHMGPSRDGSADNGGLARTDCRIHFLIGKEGSES